MVPVVEELVSTGAVMARGTEDEAEEEADAEVSTGAVMARGALRLFSGFPNTPRYSVQFNYLVLQYVSNHVVMQLYICIALEV